VDEITTVESDADGTIHYEYDVRKRLLSKAREGAVLEAFQVDAAGNLHERGPDAEPRVHGQGSKLLKRGSTEYLYDDRGFLLEKRRGDFARDRLDRWRYHWGPFDLLESAELPDGRRVSFRYDAFARRVRKLVSRTDAQGQTDVLSEIHYVWDLDTLLHEVRTGAGGDPPSTTTYLFENNEDGIPLAQREGAGGAGDWLYFVGDAIETPEEMVDGSGAPRGRMQRSAFGVAAPNRGGAATALRFTGQYADEETGLSYNRYRYYDPEVGRYISPDPIGIDGGFNLYAYGPNPVGWVDPAGLTHEMTVVSALDKSGLPLTIPKEGQKYQSGCSDCTLPPGATKDGQFPKDLASQAKCHTERKLDHDLGKNGKRLDGANVTVQGTFPPCPNCHRAMQKIAEGPPKMAALKYQWPDPHGNMQSMTYPGDKNGPVPGTTDKAGKPVAGGDAAALAKAYQMQKDTSKPSGYAFDNHSGRVPDPNNPGKTVVDPNSAAGQYKKQADAIDPNRGR
jgi:RHS repeat-associated protein